MRKWIRITEQEPPLHTPIMVTDGQVIGIARWIFNPYFGKGLCYDFNKIKKSPSYWMNLPELPK